MLTRSQSQPSQVGWSESLVLCQLIRTFFLPEPVAFRRVHGLEAYSRTSRESNHHRQSVSAVKNNALPTEPRGHLSADTNFANLQINCEQVSLNACPFLFEEEKGIVDIYKWSVVPKQKNMDVSLNHGRSTAPPVCRICGAEITRLALPCQVKAASPLSLGFTLMHLWAGVAFSDNRKPRLVLETTISRVNSKRRFSTQLWLMSVRPLAHSRNSNNIWVSWWTFELAFQTQVFVAFPGPGQWWSPSIPRIGRPASVE